MALLPGGQHDPSQYNDMRDFKPVPPGQYIAKVQESEIKETSTGGQMLVLTFGIAAGAYSGKSFITRLNLVNSNPVAVKIANETLATITRACGLGLITDSDVLHGIPMVVTLKLNPGQGKYGPSNEPAGFKTAQGLTAPPENPEPDAATLAIINNTAAASTPVTAESTTPTKAPAGFGATPPPPAQQQSTATTPPPPGQEPVPTPHPAQEAVVQPTPATTSPAVADGNPPW